MVEKSLILKYYNMHVRFKLLPCSITTFRGLDSQFLHTLSSCLADKLMYTHTNDNRDQSLFRTVASHYWGTDPHLFIHLGFHESVSFNLKFNQPFFVQHKLIHATNLNCLDSYLEKNKKNYKAGFGYWNSVYNSLQGVGWGGSTQADRLVS